LIGMLRMTGGGSQLRAGSIGRNIIRGNIRVIKSV
jgi:hypothetical protein